MGAPGVQQPQDEVGVQQVLNAIPRGRPGRWANAPGRQQARPGPMGVAAGVQVGGQQGGGGVQRHDYAFLRVGDDLVGPLCRTTFAGSIGLW